jgi:hypothetical protein
LPDTLAMASTRGRICPMALTCCLSPRTTGDALPAWYLNLCAQPRVAVQVGRRKGVYLARTASPAERRDLWPRLAAYHPPYRHHQEQAQRAIPVVLISPVAEETPA